MPKSAKKLYGELYGSGQAGKNVAVDPNPGIDKISQEIINSVVGTINDVPELRSQILSKLAESISPSTDNIEKVAYDDDMVKVAMEYEAAGRFMAQGFIAGMEEHEGFEKSSEDYSHIYGILHAKMERGEPFTEEEQYIYNYLHQMMVAMGPEDNSEAAGEAAASLVESMEA